MTSIVGLDGSSRLEAAAASINVIVGIQFIARRDLDLPVWRRIIRVRYCPDINEGKSNRVLCEGGPYRCPMVTFTGSSCVITQ